MRQGLVLLLTVAAACSGRSLEYLSSSSITPGPLNPDAPLFDLAPDARERPDAAPPPDGAGTTSSVPDRAVVVDRAPPPPDAAAADLGAPPDLGDAPVDRGTPALQVFLVAGAVPLSPADSVIERQLTARGLQVVPVDDDLLGTVDTGAAALIFISNTVSTGPVGARFRDVAKPVVLAEPLLYDDMGLVDSTVAMGVNRGFDPNLTTIQIETPAGPLAAGLQGSVVILTEASDISWGIPNGNAVRVASLPGQPTKLAIFGYEAGAQMPELVAPARRVGLFLSGTNATLLTAQGFALFDAAIAWALQR